MKLEFIFGMLAAAGWIVSSWYWIKSTKVKTPFITATLIKADPINAYFDEIGRINQKAGYASAGSAVLSAIAIICGAYQG